MAANDLVAEIESEFEEESGSMDVPLKIAYLGNFKVLGFETTAQFQQNFFTLNQVLRKRQMYWSTKQFRDDFCSGRHYVINVSGLGMRRYAVLRDMFPVEYQVRQGQPPLLVNIGGPGKSVAVLEAQGRPVRIPYRPCGVPKVPVGRRIFNIGKDLLIRRLTQ